MRRLFMAGFREMNTSGLELRQMREALGITASELARAMVITPGAVVHLERRKRVRATTARRYEAALEECARTREGHIAQFLINRGLSLVHRGRTLVAELTQ